MKIDSLHDLTAGQLQQLYSAEVQIAKMLLRISSAVAAPKLKRLLRERLRQAKIHVSRIQRVAKKLGMKLKKSKCIGIDAIIAEGTANLRKNVDPNRVDSIIIATVRQLEHYKIAACGTVRTYLEALGKGTLAELLQETLDEGMRMDNKLNRLAEQSVNLEADIRL